MLVKNRKNLKPHPHEVHVDDAGVDKLARAMKRKLAKKCREGFSGWDDPNDCDVEYLAELLIDEVCHINPDPVDIANFAMMLYVRKGGKAALKKRSQKAFGW